MAKKYSVFLRAMPIGVLCLGIFLLLGSVFFFVNQLTDLVHKSHDIIIGSLFAVAMVATVALCITVRLTQSTWLFLNQYSISGSLLQVYCPASKKLLIVDLKDAVAVSGFMIFGPPKGNATQGRKIKFNAGLEVHISESHPSWPDIAKLLEFIPFEPAPAFSLGTKF
ncbi:MAG: hypothetical protein H7Z41_15320 [Cytophagales bacterium]|nr:hypothetical protein [Armatimonadota bacterium]